MNGRSDFLVYIVDEEQGSRELIQATLEQAGYRVLTFSDPDLARSELPITPPHVVLTTDFPVGVNASDILSAIQNQVPETQLIFLEENRDVERTLEILRLGAYGFLRKPLSHLPEIVVQVDRAVEKIFLNQKNETLLTEIQRKQDVIEAMEARARAQFEDSFVANELFDALSEIRGPQELIEAYLQHMGPVLGEERILFLKHSPAYYSLSLTQGYGVDLMKFRNLGVSFKDRPQMYPEVLERLENEEGFREFMGAAFQTQDYVVCSVVVAEEVYGALVFLRRIDEPHLQRILNLSIRALSLQLENILLEKKIHDQAVRDWLTGLPNKKYFLERMDEEISRARRLQIPISIIRADIDHMAFYNQLNGTHAGDLLIRMIGNLMKKTSRKIDLVGYFGSDEFAILLPHTPGIGAAVRAERLRKIIENAQFPYREQQPLGTVTLSFGVSEYPGMSLDAESLIESASRALDQVKATTRNQVLLVNPPKGHLPDFGANDLVSGSAAAEISV